VRVLQTFSPDWRSLALFRICLGLATAYDVWGRLQYCEAHYSDQGVLPRTTVRMFFPIRHFYSVHMESGETWIQEILFAVQAFVALLLAVGYHTTLATIVTWYLVYSTHVRNPLVIHGGDQLHRCILFLCIFVPLGRQYSVDRAIHEASYERRRGYSLSKRAQKRLNARTVAGIVLVVQMFVMYLSAHFHKTGAEWTSRGSAGWIALQLDYYRKWFGDVLLMMPTVVIQMYTFGTLYWQQWGPILWFSPVQTDALQTLCFAGFFSMHAAFGMALRLGFFTMITLTCTAIIAPTCMWNAIDAVLVRHMTRSYASSKREEERAASVMYYRFDGSIVHVLLACVRTAIIPHAVECVDMDKSDARWLVVRANGATRGNAPALLLLLTQSKVPMVRWLHAPLTSAWTWICWFRGSPRQEALPVAAHAAPKHASRAALLPATHSRFSTAARRASMWLKRVRRALSGFGRESMAVVCMVLVLSWNAGNFSNPVLVQFSTPRPIQKFVVGAGLQQHWNMFAPRPPSISWWPIIVGELENGTQVELFHNRALFTRVPNRDIDWTRPRHESFGNHRWFKYFEYYGKTDAIKNNVRLDFGKYVCRVYNAEGQRVLYMFRVHSMSERVDVSDLSILPSSNRISIGDAILWDHVCYVKPGDNRFFF